LILSLLTAVCGCVHDIDADPQQEESAGGVDNSNNSTNEAEQEAEYERQGDNDPEPQEEQGGNENEPPEVKPPEEQGGNEEEPPEETTPEVPPVVEPPETEPPEVPPVVEPEISLLLINELKMGFITSLKRPQYIEFKTLGDGNLDGFSLHIMNDKNNPFVYYFPNINVKQGEYIVLHLQTFDVKSVDELGDNLNLSGGDGACTNARDLWTVGTNKILQNTDIVYLQNKSGKIIDAIVMNEKPSMTWDKECEHFTAIVEYLCSVGAWEYEDDYLTAYDAVNTSSINLNLYMSVCRFEFRANHFNTTDWYVTASGGNFTSPGLPNYK